MRKARIRKAVCLSAFVMWIAAVSCDLCAAAERPSWLTTARRIVFVGDSITYAGHYVSVVEARLRIAGLDPLPELINVGLPSETCSGLSEPDHPFPRPDVHERLSRVLQATQPDVVVACYGMNDGIYHPFDEKRFAAYRDGVNRLIDKVHAAGAKLVLMTPPPFDPLPLEQRGVLRPAGVDKYAWFAVYEDYDDVLARYAAWILAQTDRVEMVIDLHTPINAALSEARKGDPKHTMAGDGIHLDAHGHRLLAATILDAWGFGGDTQPSAEVLELIDRRQQLLRDAWLTHVGHKRPGIKDGLPLAAAQERSTQLDGQINQLVSPE